MYKRFIASLLAVMLAFSSSFTAFAGSEGAAGSNAGQGDTSIGSGTSGSGNGTWKLPANTGFRFTICTAEGVPVSAIMGSKSVTSLDVVNSGVNLSVGEVWTACATAEKQGMNDYMIQPLSMQKFLSFITEPGHDFRWTDSVKGIYGNEVREFILKGATSIEGSGIGGGSTEPPKGEEAAGSNYQDATDYVAINSSFGAILDNLLTQSKGATAGNSKFIIDRLTNLRQAYLSKLKALPEAERVALQEMWNSKLMLIASALYGSGRLGQVYDNFKITLTDLGTSKAAAESLSLFELLGGIEAYAAEGQGQAIDFGSVAGALSVLLNKNSVVYKILNLQVNGAYVFQLEGSAKTEAEYQAGGKPPSEIFLSNNYVLLVEPTIQGCPQGWNSAKKTAGVSYKSLVYGTAHNWARFGNSASFKSSGAFSNTFGNHQSYLTRLLPNALVTVADWQSSDKLVLKQASAIEQWSIAEMTARFNEGYGCHVYTVMDLGVVPTKLIDTSSLPPSETPTEKDFIINRFFRQKNKDNTYTYTKFDSHSYNIKEEARSVSISGQAEGSVLVGWGSSESEKFVPDTNKAASEYKWEEVSKKNTGSEKGNSSKVLEITADSKIKTINVLYEIGSSTQVIKVYENTDGTTEKVTDSETVTGKDYTVQDEPEYVYVENKTSENPAKSVTGWEDTEGSGGSENKITISETTKTIYILYQKQDPNTKPLELYSNELSFTYDLRDLLQDRILAEVYDRVPSSPGTRPSCDGHDYDCGEEDCGGHTEYCVPYGHGLSDPFWSIKVSDSYDYDSGTTFIREVSSIGRDGGTWAANIHGVEPSSVEKAIPNLRFMLYRDKVKDLITLYPNKNEALKDSLSSIGISSEGYSPAGTRIAKTGIQDKSFSDTLTTHFEYTEHDISLKWLWPNSRCDRSNGGSYETVTVKTPEDANAVYSKSGNVREWYLLGEENTGTQAPTDVRDSFGEKFKYSQSYSKGEAELQFYPYAKMIYRNKDGNSNQQPVYVTSENLSSMRVFNAVQTGVYKKSVVNANLDSTQWSTHARSLNFIEENEINNTKSVLPGGAILNLDLGEQGSTVVGIRLWQTCLEDELVQAVQPTGFSTSLSKAKEQAENYKTEVEHVLSGYGLVQYGVAGAKMQLSEITSGEELHENQQSSLVAGGGKTSGDTKYYLRQDGSGSSRANFDVLESRIDRQTVYTVKADVDGNIWVEKDGALVGNKSTKLADLLSNAEIKLLDDNTKLVSNLYSALDRGLGGQKYSRYGTEKYNEAFDGVSVLVTDISYDIGFGGDAAVRTCVLDPMLLSKAESKSELYNFDEESVRSSIFVTTENSSYGSGTGYLGTLGADSTMGELRSGLNNMQTMAFTRPFYFSNFSVSDLN